jgi:hypothetical protein
MIIAATLVSPESPAGNSLLNLQRLDAAAFRRRSGTDVFFWEECMPGRGRSTFNKRQKEISRQEKRREKAARKQQRKLEKQSGPSENSAGSDIAESPLTDSPPSSDEATPDSNFAPETD